MANDGDIHFPPSQRRDKPAFEPPPWEREQFEELAKRKQEAEPEPVVAPAPEPQPAREPETPAEVQAPAVPADAEQAPQEVPKRGEIDEKHVEVLMMGLRAEEPRPEAAYWKVTTVAGAVCALIGLLLGTWGAVASFTPSESSFAKVHVIAATGLVLFGLGFIGTGVWLVVRSLRQQGVL